jgi:hypothetical protein
VKTVSTHLVKAEMLSAPMEMLSAPIQSSPSNDRAVKAEWAEVEAKKRADATARRVKYYCDDLQYLCPRPAVKQGLLRVL